MHGETVKLQTSILRVIFLIYRDYIASDYKWYY